MEASRALIGVQNTYSFVLFTVFSGKLEENFSLRNQVEDFSKRQY